tara:strand:+ start:3104 stop:3904 length:801 start_codon:yes stop_codon:yes gene_type:complete
MYIGTKPESGFITTAKQRVTSSTNNYVDLDHSISSLSDCILWVNSIKQDSTNLTLTTSTRITLGGTLTASDIVEIAYLGKAVATQTPSSGTVTNDMLVNSSITLNGSAVSLGGSATVGGANTPSFQAKISGNQSISNETLTKIQASIELFDTDNAYDNSSNYRFTPQTAGKYIIYYSVLVDSASNNNNIDYIYAEIHKNGTAITFNMLDFRDDRDGRKFTVSQQIAVDMNGSSDYVELFAIGKVNSAGDLRFASSNTYFGGYKLIT